MPVANEPSKKKKKQQRKKKERQSDVEKTGSKKVPSRRTSTDDPDADAALIIQRLARRRAARRRVIELTKQAYEKLYDDESGAFYYWNNQAGVAQWTKPRVLGPNDDCAMAQPDLTKPSPRHQSLSSRTPRTVRIPESEGEAAMIIQGLLRRRAARRRVIELTKQAYEKLYDDESGVFYYWNNQAGVAQWTKPRVLGPNDDCPMEYENQMQQEEEEEGAAVVAR